MGSFRKVDQFHSGTDVGDAVTNDMFEIRRVLRNAGYESDIFADHIPPTLEKQVQPITEYTGDSSCLLIVHHSMGFDSFERVVGLPARKILRYHNITPAHFFSDDYMKSYSDKGRKQLREYVRYIELALADSQYNCEELRSVGYKYTGVLPIFFNPRSILEQEPIASVLQELAETFNVLFVGRLSRNKKQADLVRIFEQYNKLFNQSSRLILVGSSETDEKYSEKVRLEIKTRDLEQFVYLTGKVSLPELVAYYRSSHVFLSASEHEGFGVPLLEAMTFDLPVVAFLAAAIPHTMADAGVLLNDKDPELWSEIIEELRQNKDFRTKVLEGQRARLAELDIQHSADRLLELINDLALAARPLDNMKPTIQIQGPFESSYGLATVNRNLALALNEEGTYDVSIYCTEGPGDYTPEDKVLADKPGARWLWKKSKLLTAQPDVVIRNLYPPRVRDISGKLNFLLFFWEDSLVPRDWVGDFNQSLVGILAPSRHVERVLRDSGVTIPIHLFHPGVGDTFFALDSKAQQSASQKLFTFLHVSSGFPRKGVDVLLEAFFSEFAASDNVLLIIKTFPNVHNNIAQRLQSWRARSHEPPRSIHIDEDIEQEKLEELYRIADCMVYPTRAEGFGLPIAEAMARKIPVIVTSYSGQMEFCTTENAFLIDYRLGPSKSHFNILGAK